MKVVHHHHHVYATITRLIFPQNDSSFALLAQRLAASTQTAFKSIGKL